MNDIYDKVEETSSFLESSMPFKPQLGLILGTGLSGLVDRMEVSWRMPYSDIPHFLKSTVESHKGELILGKLGGKTILVMAGRFHYYEGYSSKEITFPVRVKAIKKRNILM